MTPTTAADKVKEIISSWMKHHSFNPLLWEDEFDQWAASEEGSRLVGELGEGWISVEDRLPEIPPKYVDEDEGVYITPCNINVLVWDGESVYEKSFGIIDWGVVITHWQPLPEPPKP